VATPLVGALICAVLVLIAFSGGSDGGVDGSGNNSGSGGGGGREGGFAVFGHLAATVAFVGVSSMLLASIKSLASQYVRAEKLPRAFGVLVRSAANH
jgi:hypothetical protein